MSTMSKRHKPPVAVLGGHCLNTVPCLAGHTMAVLLDSLNSEFELKSNIGNYRPTGRMRHAPCRKDTSQMVAPLRGHLQFAALQASFHQRALPRCGAPNRSLGRMCIHLNIQSTPALTESNVIRPNDSQGTYENDI